MPKISKTGYIILGILNCRPMTGYDMKKAIERSISKVWNISLWQIYPALKKLEVHGFVAKKVELDEDKVKARRIYFLTEKGNDALKNWLSTPVEDEQLKHEVLMKVFFGDLVPAMETIGAVEDFRSKTIQKLKELDKASSYLKNNQNDEEEFNGFSQYQHLAFLFGEYVYGACIAWADKALKALRNLKWEEIGNHRELSSEERGESIAEVINSR